MMAGNSNWWSTMNYNMMHPPPPSHYPPPPSSSSSSSSLSPHQYSSSSVPDDQISNISSLALNSLPHHHHHPQDFRHSWSQLLLGGVAGDQEADDVRYDGGGGGGSSSHFQPMKLENWENQMFDPSLKVAMINDHVKQDAAHQSTRQNHDDDDHDGGDDGDDHNYPFQLASSSSSSSSWSQVMAVAVSSPSSCVTTPNTNNFLDFSNTKPSAKINQHPDHHHHHHHHHLSSECNSSGGGGVSKKAKVHSSSSQPPLKVRKEKLGDRITALHQIVSPFGKTDTASVLLEAIGYIRFLQGQIEALSYPYLGNGPGNMRLHHSDVVQGERKYIFETDNGQMLNNNCLKRRTTHKQSTGEGGMKDLRSRGLCLVPVSCTNHVGNDNNGAAAAAADHYWAPALGTTGGF